MAMRNVNIVNHLRVQVLPGKGALHTDWSRVARHLEEVSCWGTALEAMDDVDWSRSLSLGTSQRDESDGQSQSVPA
jgi:hypothetical protein